ncbi:phage tail tape measure protein [Ligilactobacillus murinus]|uniref:Phage tail tape measure protein n=1 Tax=Ligilactobacillus murinus TaxID=1622 RepID=A0A4S2ELD7_9LACO|nr:phage tail tape measure protein [Ligilactobacillus murinus]TGY56929.1 phage tail tape measure protein [Ligilactobacillus murinus]
MSTYDSRVTLGANITQYVAAFREATAIYKKFNQEIIKGSMSSTDALAKSSNIVSTAVKATAVGVTALGVAAIKTGMDFEHQMSRVGAISGANAKELKAMNDQAIKLGADTAFSAKEAAQGMEALASAGFDANQIMAATPGVMDLAAVSGGDVGAAAEYAATALNGFGLEADKSTHVADVFARAAADTNAEAKDMGEALKMVAPQAHTAGLSLEETAAAIGLLSNAGIKGSEAGSNLAMALTRVQNPSGEAKKAMDQLGYSAFDSSGKMKPLAQQMSELREKLEGMTDQQKQYYLSEIYGVQGGRAVNVLLSQRSDALQDLTGKLQNSDGAASEMAKTMQNDLKSSVEQFFGSLESLAIIIEQTFGGVLKSGVDAATDKIGQFNDYLQKNQAEIQKSIGKGIEFAKSFMDMLPSIESVTSALKIALPAFLALETFKGIGVGGAKTIQFLETLQADLSLVRTGIGMTGSAISAQNSIISMAFGGIYNSSKKAVSGLNHFLYMSTSASGAEYMASKIKGVGSALAGIPSKATNATKSLITFATNPKQAAISLNGAYAKLLGTMGASEAQIASLAPTAISSSGAVAGLGASLGSLTIIAAGVAVVATAIYMAWSSNFMNIQGVVKTAISGIKSMFSSMKPAVTSVLEALKPIGSILGGILKVVGALAIGALVMAAIQLATGLRLVADVLVGLIKLVTSAGNVFKALGQAMTGDFKGASKSIGAAKKDLGQAMDAAKDMGQAFADAGKIGYESFSQLGKGGKEAKESSDSATNSTKQLKKSVEAVSNSAKEMKTTFESSKAKFSELINIEGVSDKTKQFLTDVNNTLDQYQANAQKASDKYSKAMTDAEELTGKKRVEAVNKANKDLANATQQNGQNLLNITSDLDRQLQDKRFSDGTAMTEDQVKLLTDQNNAIKQKLIEQNQIFADAQMTRLQNGEKLNQQEREATITTLQANYELRSQQIQQGEEKIKQLKDQLANAQDQTTKAQLQQQITQQEAHNQQMLNQQLQFGTQMNMTIANGSKLNFDTWSNGLKNMSNVTNEQLQSMYLAFVKMNGDTGQQMQAFALMLQQTGTQGVDNLVQALSTGKATTTQIAQAIAKDGTDGLNSLPPGMFAKGDEGKNKFIEALKAGDFKGAGKYLATQSGEGAKDSSKHSEAGKENGDNYSKGLKQKKSEAKDAGTQLAESSVKGTKSKKADMKDAGDTLGYHASKGVSGRKGDTKDAGDTLGYHAARGVASRKGDVRDAGDTLGYHAAAGVRGRVGDMRSAGSQLAAGVASGISSNTGAAVSAMASLVASVNAEAKKVAKIHSPSRLMRDEVGKFLALGVAVGITENEDAASKAMGNMIENIQSNVTRLDLLLPNPINDSNINLNSTNELKVSSFDTTNNLLRRLIDKKQVIVLDSGAVVGETKDLYNTAFGEDIQLQTRWN